MVNGKEKLVLAYKSFFDSHDGKVILKHLLQISNFVKTTYNPSEPASLMYNEGRRSIVLDMLRTIELNEVEVLNLIRNIKKEVN